MSNVVTQQKKRPLRRQRSISQVHYNLCTRQDEMSAKPLVVPTASLQIKAYELQVAGHKSDREEPKYLGLLQCNNGRVLKPIIKASQRREVDFYTKVFSSKDPDLVELRKYMPKFYGTQKFTYNGYEQDYIILEDLTEKMLEPCIMDVKIGKRTWDPLATKEKIEKEQTKYKLCKEEYGFCIPGYHVYKLDTGKLQKYDKDYGKKLHGHMVKTAIRKYLNAVGRRVCRALLLQQLAALWALRRWAGGGRRLRLYATSLLLVYDAARLRDCCARRDDVGVPKQTKCEVSSAAPRRKSIHSLHPAATGSNFSGQISEKGPIYKKVQPVPISSLALAQTTFSLPRSPLGVDRLHKNHSVTHNYEDELCRARLEYRALLGQVAGVERPGPWASVALIDFAHAFWLEEEDIDTNFKDGLDSFIQIFEDLMRETDDQIF